MNFQREIVDHYIDKDAEFIRQFKKPDLFDWKHIMKKIKNDQKNPVGWLFWVVVGNVILSGLNLAFILVHLGWI